MHSETGARIRLDALPSAARDALRCLQGLLAGAPAWLVGGAVRDALEGRAPPDLDVTAPRGALALGRALAARLGAAFVMLDEARGACRVVVGGPSPLQLDLTEFRAPTLAGDLRARDFTVNALAASIDELLRHGSAAIEDPTGGLADLAAGVVRPCGPRSIDDDPVRALRAVRLGLREGWRLEPSTESAVRNVAGRITQVAAERVRDELVAILADSRSGTALRTLDRLGVLPALLPESLSMRQTAQPAPHRFDVWEHSLRAVEAAEVLVEGLAVLDPWGEALGTHLAEDLGDRLSRREALKLAALLHDISKPETRSESEGRVRFIGHDAIGAARTAEVARRWRLSRRAGIVLERLVAEHLRPMHLAQSGGATRRARHR
ncbi:MAG TPA: HD domain-containing protein, partial [Methylomirabilota bacterium]|nr:HD domain-containing protein [Methylomirabilota bacterium]